MLTTPMRGPAEPPTAGPAPSSEVIVSYDFVQARWYTAGAIREYRAIVVHMAEGGGTVGYLAKVDRDVSASHVIEYSGRIVQMVKDGDASHGQYTSPEPYTTASFGIYSSSIGKAVLGDGWADVNRYVFAVEIEGFRATGPNAVQVASLKALVADLRARHPSLRGLLGHRDIQDKACPGGLIPWAAIGGHGLFVEDNDMFPVVTVTPLAAPNPRKFVIAAGVRVNGYDPARPGVVVKSAIGPTGGTSAYADAEAGVTWVGTTTPPIPRGGPFLRVVDGVLAGLLIVKALVTLDPVTPPLTVDTLAIRRLEYDRVKTGTTSALTFPPRP